MDVSSVNESHLVFAIDVSAEFTPSFLAGRCAAHPTTVSDQVSQSQETTPSIRAFGRRAWPCDSSPAFGWI